MLIILRRKPLCWIFGVGLIALCLFPSPLEATSQDEMKQMYDPIIKIYGRRYNVPSDLIHSVIAAESAYNSRAVSPKGAAGLMQLMPETAARYGVQDRFNAEQNIMGGVQYLRDLCRLYRNRTNLVLAAYNAGQDALKKFNGIPPYPETREYIRRVMASYSNPWIKGGTPVRRITSPDGKAIFTNDPYYHLNIRKDNQ